MGDPELKKLVDEPWAVTWAGPEGHFVGYPLREGELYNMIICCSVKSTTHGKSLNDEDWLVTADNEELRRRFDGWCSPVQKLCALAGQVSSWTSHDRINRKGAAQHKLTPLSSKDTFLEMENVRPAPPIPMGPSKRQSYPARR